jgi:hypothetical protein
LRQGQPGGFVDDELDFCAGVVFHLARAVARPPWRAFQTERACAVFDSTAFLATRTSRGDGPLPMAKPRMVNGQPGGAGPGGVLILRGSCRAAVAFRLAVVLKMGVARRRGRCSGRSE